MKTINLRRPSYASLGALLTVALIGALLLGMLHGRSANRSPTSSSAPWVYGRADARFTVVEYADLECAYCRAYFPILSRWVDDHPEVNWQWHHLPLAMHDPAATAEALFTECAGASGGAPAFWKSVAWVYASTQGDGRGLPQGTSYPNLTPEIQRCLTDPLTHERIRGQAEEATRDGIAATPTLRLVDHRSGAILVLNGPVEGDALLSAFDWLNSDEGRSISKPIPKPNAQ